MGSSYSDHIASGMCEENAHEIHHGIEASGERWKILLIGTFNPLDVRKGGGRCSGGQNGLDNVIDGVWAGDHFRRGLDELLPQMGGFSGVCCQRVDLFDQASIADGFEQ